MLLEAGKFFGKKFLTFLPWFGLIKWNSQRIIKKEFRKKFLWQLDSQKKQDQINFVIDYYKKHGKKCPVCGQWTSKFYICLYCNSPRGEGYDEAYYIENNNADVYLSN
jgi:hypothetical protein